MGWALVVAVCGWLFFAAAILQVEYYDGLDSIYNASYFAGRAGPYQLTRLPLLGLLLVPAELAHRALGLHPLDFRPQHLTMALVLSAYVAGCWLLLVRLAGRTWPVLIAFACAVPTFLFFSYSPFINHDIVPGVLLLAMVFAYERHRRDPALRHLVLLCVAGVAAALIKNTFALFWIFLVLADGGLALTAGADRRRRLGVTARLCGAALLSGAVVWLVLGAAIGSTGDTPWWLAPEKQIRFMVELGAGNAGTDVLAGVSQWSIFVNFPAYGWVSALLILPALVIALRGDHLRRVAALLWIALFATLFFVGREVRYVAFLAPLTALLLVGPLEILARHRFALPAVLVVLAVNVAPGHEYFSVLSEATRYRDPFYAGTGMRTLLDPLVQDGRREPVLVNWGMLSFAPAGRRPMGEDPYHRAFHFGRHHFAERLGYRPADVVSMTPSEFDARVWPPHTALVLANGPPIANSAVIRAAADGQPLVQSTLLAKQVEHEPTDGGWIIAEGGAPASCA